MGFNKLDRRLGAVVTGTFTSLLFSGCIIGDGGGGGSASELPNEGYSAIVRADYDQTADSASVAARVFKDRVQFPLAGGDVIEVTSGEQSALLSKLDTFSATYSGSLPVSDPNNGFTFRIEHKPEDIRVDRWYPADEVAVQTEPGPFVGLYGQGNFPDQVDISSPAADTRYISADSPIFIEWSAGSNADIVEIGAYARCTGRFRWLDTRLSNGNLETTPRKILTRGSSFVDEVADFFVDIMLTPFRVLFGSELTDSRSISQCNIDIVVTASEKRDLQETNLAGGILLSSRTATVRVNFEPLEPFKL